MSDSDAIELVLFDDEPALKNGPLPPSRRGNRSRPDPSGYPRAEPIPVVTLEDEAPTGGSVAAGSRNALPFDIGFVDGQTGTFLVLYAAGRLLDAKRPRTVVLQSAAGDDCSRTGIMLWKRARGSSRPVPYVAFQFPENIAGKPLRVSCADAAEFGDWTMEVEGGKAITGHSVGS